MVAVTWSFTTIGVPKAPTAVTAVRGNAQATVSWTQGADGGSPITGYVITVRRGATVDRTVTLTGTGPLTSTIITGLTNGMAYNFRVQAVNTFGTGAISAASAAVTPATVPNAANDRRGHSGRCRRCRDRRRQLGRGNSVTAARRSTAGR